MLPANGSKESSSPHLQAFPPFVVVGGTWSLRSYAAAAILFRCLQCQQLLLQAVWKQGEESLCLLPAVLLLLLLLLLLFCKTRIKSTPDLGSLRQVVQQFAPFLRGRKARKQEGRGVWIISQASKQASKQEEIVIENFLRARERERRMVGGRRLALSFAVRSLRRRSALNILPSSSYAAIHLVAPLPLRVYCLWSLFSAILCTKETGTCWAMGKILPSCKVVKKIEIMH
jgi:hypothetical protein